MDMFEMSILERHMVEEDMMKMDIFEINRLLNNNVNVWVDENGTGYLELNEVPSPNIIYNVLKQIFILFFVFVGAGTTAILVISFTVYNHINKEYNAMVRSDYITEDDENDNETEDETEDEAEFLIKYLDEYNDLEERDIENEELTTFKDLYLEEKTPKGVIIMCYNKSTGAFEYFSDSKDLPYSYLEVIACSYVIKYRCKELLINTSLELENAQKLKEQLENKTKERNSVLNAILDKDSTEEEKGVSVEAEVSKKSSTFNVFARFKGYNADSQITTNTMINNNKNKDSIKDKETKDKNVILLERSNHYIYKGKIEDYYKEHNNKDKVEEFEHLDYNAFKRLSTDEKKNL